LARLTERKRQFAAFQALGFTAGETSELLSGRMVRAVERQLRRARRELRSADDH
jgi:DNA-directed RNA polymerase specialized sigma24 family protein